jgi:hypothetical protein
MIALTVVSSSGVGRNIPNISSVCVLCVDVGSDHSEGGKAIGVSMIELDLGDHINLRVSPFCANQKNFKSVLLPLFALQSVFYQAMTSFCPAVYVAFCRGAVIVTI